MAGIYNYDMGVTACMKVSVFAYDHRIRAIVLISALLLTISMLLAGCNNNDASDAASSQQNYAGADDTDFVHTGEAQQITNGLGFRGTLEIALVDSGVFSGIEEAQKTFELGSIRAHEASYLASKGYNNAFVVFTLEIHNIDAEGYRDYAGNPYVFNATSFDINKCKTKFTSLSDPVEVYSDGSFYGYFSVAPGETKRITFGYWCGDLPKPLTIEIGHKLFELDYK